MPTTRSRKAGRYVQGGGCTTVGVAGLVQSGGFGSFSKRYGMAAASLLEAEVVTADGVVRIANACTNPDLFWALKGGGGGSLGVVTRLTLRMHAAAGVLRRGVRRPCRRKSDAALPPLIERFVAFYRERLFNPHWGEQVAVPAATTCWGSPWCSRGSTAAARTRHGSRSSTGWQASRDEFALDFRR